MDPDKGVAADSWSLLFSEMESDSLYGSGRQFSGLDYPFRAQVSDVNPQAQGSGEKDWDSRTILSNLSFLEKKIHQLQDLVHLVVGRRDYVTDDILLQQQQLITADLTSIIVQLISTAGSLLPSVKKHIFSSERSSVGGGELNHQKDVVLQQSNSVSKVEDQSESKGFVRTEPAEDHEMKSDDDVDDMESLTPGSYQILQLEKEEILAPHTHFCMICGKGFKRDANLRMHMRGHGDEYKTPAALAKPNKEAPPEPVLLRRYSCPYAGCKRNKDHKKFQPLKTILCVKNHYKRTHCDKTYMCSRCNSKKFSVIADLKTHEKHCGRDKWLCSCGTTFSRKDKLFGHIGLFQGHTPVIPAEEIKGYSATLDQHCNEAANTKVEQPEFKCNLDAIDVEGPADNSTRYASPLFFDKNSSYQDIPRRTQFEDCGSSFSFFTARDGYYAGSSNTE